MKKIMKKIRRLLPIVVSASIIICTLQRNVYAYDEAEKIVDVIVLDIGTHDSEEAEEKILEEENTSIEESNHAENILISKELNLEWESNTENDDGSTEISDFEERFDLFEENIPVDDVALDEECALVDDGVTDNKAIEEKDMLTDTATITNELAINVMDALGGGNTDTDKEIVDIDYGNGSGEYNSYTADDVNIIIEKASENSLNGMQNNYKFSFATASGEARYSAYVYGEGVNEDICKSIASAYFNGATETIERNKIINDSLVDADKTSVNKEYNVGYDSKLCWAYAAADALWQSDWVKKINAGVFNVDGSAADYFRSVDDLTSYAAYNFTDTVGDEYGYWRWLFTGNYLAENLKHGFDADDALLSEYYGLGLYRKNILSASYENTELNDTLNYIENNNVAASLGIYHKGGGGHAVSLVGFIRDDAGNPVAVIIADPDDAVPYNPDDSSGKFNAYCVYPIEYVLDGDSGTWEFKLPTTEYYTYDAKIGDVSLIIDSEDAYKVNESIIPMSIRAISDDFDNDLEYFMDDSYTFDIPLNFDFLSFYDINKLKYRLFNDEDEKISESTIEYNKGEWKELLNTGAVNITLYFDNTLSGLNDGKYRIQVDIDKDCFFGNYGWFAERYNGGEGYFDRLVNVWINLFREIQESNDMEGEQGDIQERPEISTESEKTEESVENAEQGTLTEPVEKETGPEVDISLGQTQDYHDSNVMNINEKAVNIIEKNIIGSVMKSIINEIVTEMGINYSKIFPWNISGVKVEMNGRLDETDVMVLPIDEANIREMICIVIGDLLRAIAKDETTIGLFKSIGIDATTVDIDKLNVVMATGIASSKTGLVKFSGDNIKFSQDDTVFAMIKLTDGSAKYIRTMVLEDEGIEIYIPDNTSEIMIISIK